MIPFICRSSKCSLSLRFPHKTLPYINPPPNYATHAVRISLPDFVTEKCLIPRQISGQSSQNIWPLLHISGPCSHNIDFPRHPFHVLKISVPRIFDPCSQNIDFLRYPFHVHKTSISPYIRSMFSKYRFPHISDPCSQNIAFPRYPFHVHKISISPYIRSIFSKYRFPIYPVHVHKISISPDIRSMFTKYRSPYTGCPGRNV
jgi:hypothetical protein